MQDITKRFGIFTALSNVSFNLRRGTIHALLGENGAGKTTLMKIAFGMIPPDAGEVRIDGFSRPVRRPADAIDAGVGMVHQHFMLVPAMTVTENIALGGRGTFNARTSAAQVEHLADRVGMQVQPNAMVRDLGIAAQQRVEILKILARNARILILDEPTAVLAPTEAQELLNQIRRLVTAGGSVVLITHKLRDARQFADDVSVLRKGELVLSGAISDFTDDALAFAMLGHSPERAGGEVTPDPRDHDVVISLDGVEVVSRDGVHLLHDINMNVRKGEIVGIAALEGAASPLLRILSGRSKPSLGSVVLPSEIGFIPEDRQTEALVTDFTLYENVALRNLGKRKGRMPWLSIRENTSGLVKKFDIRADRIEMRVGDLSGGNQQKLVMGRELDAEPAALIAESPTRGLDIKASAAIHQHFKSARARGCAIVFHSSDLDEIVEVANRVLVLRDGSLIEAALNVVSIGHQLFGPPEAVEVFS